MSLLDPLVIAQLGNLELRARRILDGLYAGHHLNRNRGHAQDFSEHRPYNPGDDIRSLDWKVFGRTDRLVIKQYEEQTNVGATVLFDHSLSMNFSMGGRLSKLNYAKILAAAIGYVVVSQNDAVGLVSETSRLPLGSQLGHLNRFFEQLESISATGSWDAARLIELALQTSRKRGFVAVFSDLMSDKDALISSLRSLQARKNEVMVFQVLDPVELDLSYDGPVIFTDMETGEELRTEPAAIRDDYKAWVRGTLDSFAHIFRSAGIEYLTLTTDTPFDKGMGAYLSWRGINL